MVNPEYAYPAVVQKLLNEQRVGESYEVLNGGIAGYGIMQIVDSLEQEIIKLKPDVVVISSWFNDHSTMSNWYGVYGKSDKDAYYYVKTMRLILSLPGFSRLYHSRLVGLYRYYIQKVTKRLFLYFPPAEKSKKPLQRMNLEEFDWALERVATLAAKHNFRPVFLYEPTSHAEPLDSSIQKHRYYGVIKRFADRHSFSVIDTLQAFAMRRAYGLFLDFIHPNRLGHEVMAGAVMDGFFSLTGGGVFDSSSKGHSLPRLSRVHEVHLLQSEASKVVKIRAPYAEGPTLLIVKGERSQSRIAGELTREWKEFSLVSPDTNPVPLSRVFLTARSPGRTEVGPSIIASKLFIGLESGGRESSGAKIEINGAVLNENHRGFHIALLDAESGDVIFNQSIDHFSSSNGGERVLAALIDARQLPSGSPVLLVTHTDGVQGINANRLSEALKQFGGSGALPNPFEAFIFVGSVGAPSGSAIEKHSPSRISLSFGEKSLRQATLIEW